MELGEKLVIGFECYIVFLFSTVCHEAAHALAALKLGDRTAYYGGQVTLDPMPHIRRAPFGLVIVPILSYLLGGWMIGWASAPYDPIWANRYPRRAALMALAGPATNLLLMLVAALLIRGGLALNYFHGPARISLTHATEAVSGGFASGVAVLLSVAFTLNLLLATFNMLPLPPLDGSAVLKLFMTRESAARYQQALSNPGFMYVGLMLALTLFSPVFGKIHLVAINLLYLGLGLSYHPID